MRDAVRETLEVVEAGIAVEAIWIVLAVTNGYPGTVIAIGCAVAAAAVTLLFLVAWAGGRRERSRTERRWLRAKRIPDEVPQAVWVPAIDRWRQSTWAVWPTAFVALINLALAVASLVVPDGDRVVLCVLAVAWGALAVGQGVRWVRLRPVLAAMEREKLRAEEAGTSYRPVGDGDAM